MRSEEFVRGLLTFYQDKCTFWVNWQRNHDNIYDSAVVGEILTADEVVAVLTRILE